MTGKAVFRGLEVLRISITKEMERGSGRCAEATQVPVKRTLVGPFILRLRKSGSRTGPLT
jgi:hypothetical protein